MPGEGEAVFDVLAVKKNSSAESDEGLKVLTPSLGENVLKCIQKYSRLEKDHFRGLFTICLVGQ